MEVTYQYYHHHNQALAYLDHNSEIADTPLIFIHGITASVSFWEEWLPIEIRERRRWISLSLPGHYPSWFNASVSKENIDVDFFNDVLHGFIGNVVKQPVLIVGHSTGGFMAINYAIAHPNNITGIFSIGGFSDGHWGGLEGTLQQYARGSWVYKTLFWLSFCLLKTHKFFFLKAADTYMVNPKSAKEKAVYHQTIDRIYPEVKRHSIRWQYYLFHQIPTIDITPRLPHAPVPCLILAGEQDPIVASQHTQRLAEAIPHAELHLLPDAGHLPFIEKQQTFESIIIQWLNHFTTCPRTI